MDDGFKNVAKVNSPPSEGEAATREERTLSSSSAGRKCGALKISVAQNYSRRRCRSLADVRRSSWGVKVGVSLKCRLVLSL